MTTVIISEFSDMGRTNRGEPTSALVMPPIATHTTTFTITSVQSAVLQPTTQFVRLYTAGSVAMKYGASPVATPADEQINAESIIRKVEGGNRFAFIDA